MKISVKSLVYLCFLIFLAILADVDGWYWDLCWLVLLGFGAWAVAGAENDE